MKRIKFLCALMALAVLATAALSGCKNKVEEITVDLSEYKIIRPQSGSDYASDAAMTLRSEFISLGINSAPEVGDDWYKSENDYDTDSKEILIGITNRQESTDVLSKIEGDCFAIAVSGSKIVICSPYDALLGDAVRYFCDELITDGKLVVESDYMYVSEPQSVVKLVSDGVCNYTVIRGDNSHKYVGELADSVRESIIKACDIQSVDVLVDAAVKAKDGLEILIGHTDRPESEQALTGVEADEYCIKFIGNKIVVNAWSLKGIEQAAEVFCDMVTGKASANGAICFSTASETVKALDTCINDIPAPEGLELLSAYQGLDDTYESVYKNAKSSDLDAYLALLSNKGYKKYDDNEIGGNRFATYTKGKTAVYVSFQPCDDTLRVVSETTKALPNIQAEQYTKVTESSITQISLNGVTDNFGMSYVIALEDGSYILIDGGGHIANDDTALYNFLKDNNKRTDEKIVIAAWILTHEHWDHVANFIKFSDKYASSVTLESVIWNMAQAYEQEDLGTYYEGMQKAIRKYDGVSVIKAHAGQEMQIRNAEIEILYTHENISPNILDLVNNTSTVFRVNIAGQKLLFLGDIEDMASNIIMDMYGSELKSDMVQVAHHGLWGASTEFYELVRPAVAFIPVENHGDNYKWAMDEDATKLLYEMRDDGIIKEIIVAKDGTRTISLPYSG